MCAHGLAGSSVERGERVSSRLSIILFAEVRGFVPSLPVFVTPVPDETTLFERIS